MRKAVLLVGLVVVMVVAGFAHLPHSAQEAAVPDDKIPIKFHCQAGNDEKQLVCDEFLAALKRSDLVTLDWDRSGPCFQVIVLPTARDDYRAFTVATSFLYPPLDGLWLSAFLGNFMFPPEAGTEEDYDIIVNDVIGDTAEWLVIHRDVIQGLSFSHKPVLEVMDDRGTTRSDVS